MEIDVLLSWATTEATLLQAEAQSGDPQRSPAAAVDFLRRHAAGTAFYEQAHRFVSREAAPADPWGTLKGVAEALESWAVFTKAGFADELPLEARIRVEAATDLLEQVQRLLDSPDVHPAAPIVLCGAALEEFLRSLYVGCSEPLSGRPGLSTYAVALRKTGVLSARDEKDITAWAALRNEAAHGHFDDLGRDRAKLQFEGINLFMRQKSST